MPKRLQCCVWRAYAVELGSTRRRKCDIVSWPPIGPALEGSPKTEQKKLDCQTRKGCGKLNSWLQAYVAVFDSKTPPRHLYRGGIHFAGADRTNTAPSLLEGFRSTPQRLRVKTSTTSAFVKGTGKASSGANQWATMCSAMASKCSSLMPSSERPAGMPIVL